jgi:nickel/cobalt transporter (NicO) family protein
VRRSNALDRLATDGDGLHRLGLHLLLSSILNDRVAFIAHKSLQSACFSKIGPNPDPKSTRDCELGTFRAVRGLTSGALSATAAVIAAAGVGFGHAVLPDHWAPLAVLGRTRRYPLAKVARLSGLAGVAHVLVSIALGAVIIAIGLQFRSTIETAQNAIVGSLLIATGVAFLALELTGRGHPHPHPHPESPGVPGAPGHTDPPDHTHPHDHGHPRHRSLLGVMVPFGAAASPDLTILPVFLAASAAGAGAAVGALVAFAAATIGTITLLTVFAAAGGYQVRGQWLERWGNAVTAGVLLVIGALVLTGVL